MSEAQLEHAQAGRLERTRAGAGVEPERARPYWFGDRGQELFAFYHEPAAVSCGLGVLLCNPFGYEAMCSHRSYQHLAEALAGRGFPVLRFDYHGTGDASGDDHDPDRWSAWQRSIHAAIDELRRLSGCAQVALFGLRLGANLALEAASSRHDVSALALWAPFATGRAFLREELAVHKLRALDPAFDRARREAGAGEADNEALGFAIHPQTLAALRAHRVTELSTLSARSVLVLTRDTPLQEAQVSDKLRALGASVIDAAGSGYGAMLAHNVCPEETWTRVIAFFESQLALRTELASEPKSKPKPKRLPAHAEALVWNDAQAHAPVRETASYFGPGERLFGVITHAGSGYEQHAPKPAVLLLSGGVNHHVGQNRMYTRWARRWADAGFTTLRFDPAGFGDSAAAHGGGDGQLHSPDSVGDVHAAMDHLSRVCGSRQFAIVGLCSGALLGFHAALEDPRVVRLGLLNWTRFVLDGPTQHPERRAPREVASTTDDRRYQSLRYYARLAAAPSTWWRLYQGELDVRGIGRHLIQRAVSRVRSEVRHRWPASQGDVTAQTQLARDFLQLGARGVESCVVYNGDEPILDLFQEQLGPHLGRLSRAGILRLEVLDGADHVFTPLWTQEHVFTWMTQHVLRAQLS